MAQFDGRIDPEGVCEDSDVSLTQSIEPIGEEALVPAAHCRSWVEHIDAVVIYSRGPTKGLDLLLQQNRKYKSFSLLGFSRAYSLP